MMVAVGTSTPTSTTVVATRMSAPSPAKAAMAASFSCGFMRPWISATRSPKASASLA